MKTPLIIGNWKMNLLSSEAANLAKEIQDFSQNIQNVKVILAPPFTSLHSVKQILLNSNVGLACQNFYFKEKGAYTGEISIQMIKDAGCQYAIIGHSERRKLFNESNEIINKKIDCAVNNDISVILCVGENQEQRNKGKTFEIIEAQVLQALINISTKELENICIAYEPVWAIGTGINASVKQVEEAHGFIRKIIKRIVDDKKFYFNILYGGSVDSQNCKDFLFCKEVDGVLIGGASLDINSFCDIISTASTI
tara:strand:+ start:161 stop:919 length:759 start_codon:yes stop_codon:yes gene_type:complete